MAHQNSVNLKVTNNADGFDVAGGTTARKLTVIGQTLKVNDILLGTWLIKTANYTASSGDYILTNTSGGAFTITLPSSPSTGDYVTIKSGSSAATNNLTIGRNGQTIMGSATDMTISTPNIQVTFVFDGSTWSI